MYVQLLPLHTRNDERDIISENSEYIPVIEQGNINGLSR